MAQAKQGSGISIVEYINHWGRIVLHNQLATAPQWSQCIAAFKEAKGKTPIEQIVVDQGLLDHAKAQAVKGRVKALLKSKTQAHAPAADAGSAASSTAPPAASPAAPPQDQAGPSSTVTPAARSASTQQSDDGGTLTLDLPDDFQAGENIDMAPDSDADLDTSLADPSRYDGHPEADEIVDTADIVLEPSDVMIEAVVNDAPLLAPSDVREAVRLAIRDAGMPDEEEGSYDLDIDDDDMDKDHMSEVDWADGLIGDESK